MDLPILKIAPPGEIYIEPYDLFSLKPKLTENEIQTIIDKAREPQYSGTFNIYDTLNYWYTRDQIKQVLERTEPETKEYKILKSSLEIYRDDKYNKKLLKPTKDILKQIMPVYKAAEAEKEIEALREGKSIFSKIKATPFGFDQTKIKDIIKSLSFQLGLLDPLILLPTYQDYSIFELKQILENLKKDSIEYNFIDYVIKNKKPKTINEAVYKAPVLEQPPPVAEEEIPPPEIPPPLAEEEIGKIMEPYQTSISDNIIKLNEQVDFELDQMKNILDDIKEAKEKILESDEEYISSSGTDDEESIYSEYSNIVNKIENKEELNKPLTLTKKKEILDKLEDLGKDTTKIKNNINIGEPIKKIIILLLVFLIGLGLGATIAGIITASIFDKKNKSTE